MKFNIKYFSISLIPALMVLSSCTKKLDLNPTYTINGDASFTTIADYEASLVGTYARLKANSYYGSINGSNAFVGLTDIISDNFYENGVESLNNFLTMVPWAYTADDGYIEDTWLDAYSVVQQANLTIRGIDKLSSSDPGAVNRIKGQSIALRALAHFDLFRYFGEEFDRSSSKMGIPYVEVYDINQMPSRLSVKQTYDKIEADLKTAKNLLSNTDQSIQSLTSTAAGNRAYVDSLVVDAMLARMYNYAGVSDSAIKYASYVINKRPLASQANFPLIWTDASTAEVIWAVKFEAGNSDIGGNIYYAVANRASFLPTDSLLKMYGASDVRLSSYFQRRTKGSSSRIVLSKYLAKQARLNNPDGIVDFKAFRTGEMYLIRAEAYSRRGQDVLALADLNTLRTARGASTGVETGAALLDAIFKERRKELVAEGQRFFDLKRTTRTVVRATNCSQNCNLPPSAREWAWPIPQSEITANPKMVQNPGY